MYVELNKHVTVLAKKRQLANKALLSRDLHVIPDFHGNRSPIADPNMTGMVSFRRTFSACSFEEGIKGREKWTKRLKKQTIENSFCVSVELLLT